ncbi:hypothetical protein ACHAQA_008198 [Verticillium albo-atrum]
MATPEDLARASGPPTLLCVGFLRTGTASLSVALTELGYKHVFHGLNSTEKAPHWVFFERAALAKWPNILTPRLPVDQQPQPLTRADWDTMFGPYDALTDLACFFAPELIAAYPEAKVVLTERDVEKWLPSFERNVSSGLFGPGVDWFLKGVGTIVGNRAGFAMQKILRGFFGGAGTVEELREVMPAAYEAYYQEIKDLVPADRLLVYRVGKDGWEPLCRFLEKDVPATEFPFVNETDAHDRLMKEIMRRTCWRAARITAPYLLVIAAVAYWSLAT